MTTHKATHAQFTTSALTYTSLRRYPTQGLYSSSWLYQIRASRNEDGSLGTRISNSVVDLAYGIRHGAIHLTLLEQRAPATVAALKIKEICEQLARRHRTPVLLKKFPPDLGNQIGVFDGFWKPTQLIATEVLEDDYSPEKMLSLSTTLQLAADRRSSLARKYRQFQRSGQTTEIITSNSLNPNTALEALEYLADSQVKRSAYYQMVRAAVEPELPHGTFVLAFRARRRTGILGWQGLYVAQHLVRRLGGLYCGLSTRTTPGLTEWMDVTVCRWLAQRGLRAVLLGGAETLGVQQYIKKLGPITPRTRGITLMFPTVHPPEWADIN